MGVSIEQYRMKIGTFTQKGSHRIKSNILFRTKNENASSFRLSVLISVCLLSLSIIVQYNDKLKEHNLTSHEPVPIYRDAPDHGLKKVNNSLEILDINFQARYKFGNKRKNGLKLTHLNMGSAFLTNKINEVENIAMVTDDGLKNNFQKKSIFLLFVVWFLWLILSIYNINKK